MCCANAYPCSGCRFSVRKIIISSAPGNKSRCSRVFIRVQSSHSLKASVAQGLEQNSIGRNSSQAQKQLDSIHLASILPELGIRLIAPNPIQPRNSTIQWLLLYRVKLSMLPFAMRSVPTLALFTGSVSGAPQSPRRVSSSALLQKWCALRCDFLATILFSVAYALLVSLAALFGTRSLYFQWLADSFVKYRGVGYPSSPSQHACIFRSATWTRDAHPTI